MKTMGFAAEAGLVAQAANWATGFDQSQPVEVKKVAESWLRTATMGNPWATRPNLFFYKNFWRKNPTKLPFDE